MCVYIIYYIYGILKRTATNYDNNSLGCTSSIIPNQQAQKRNESEMRCVRDDARESNKRRSIENVFNKNVERTV